MADGLIADGWWHQYGQTARDRVRTYFKFRLLANPLASELEVDRLIASVPDEARERLVKHVMDGLPGVPAGF